jgi:hypothetical protein
VHEFSFAFACPLETDVGATRLKGFEVRTGRDFAIELLTREPDFKVEGLCRRETGVAGTEQNTAIGKLQGFENFLCIARQAFVLRV